jgi:CRISP-associated protein Cas1
MHQASSVDAKELEIIEHDEWFERCQYWRAAYEASIPTRKRRERQAHPLILTGNGLSIRVNRGSLWIKDGLTHYPQDKREYRFFPGGLDNPPRIVLVDGSGEITLDALDWLAEQDIPLIRLKWNGAFASVITSGGQAANQEKVAWQNSTRHDPKARAEFALGLIIAKARNTLETLEGWVPHSDLWRKGQDAIARDLERLETNPPEALRELLSLEGKIATAYFRTWQGLQIRWKGTHKHPIPDDWREYSWRAALRDEKHQNRHATHPVNAMLNYAYGMLLARKQIEAIAEGYDPMLGVVHDRRKRVRGIAPAYALDIMEPERLIMDRTVLSLVREHEFSAADFTITSKGTCRVGVELARKLSGSAHPPPQFNPENRACRR